MDNPLDQCLTEHLVNKDILQWRAFKTSCSELVHITYPWLSFSILKELHVCNLTNFMRHTKEKYQENKRHLKSPVDCWTTTLAPGQAVALVMPLRCFPMIGQQWAQTNSHHTTPFQCLPGLDWDRHTVSQLLSTWEFRSHFSIEEQFGQHGSCQHSKKSLQFKRCPFTLKKDWRAKDPIVQCTERQWFHSYKTIICHLNTGSTESSAQVVNTTTCLRLHFGAVSQYHKTNSS